MLTPFYFSFIFLSSGYSILALAFLLLEESSHPSTENVVVVSRLIVERYVEFFHIANHYVNY